MENNNTKTPQTNSSAKKVPFAVIESYKTIRTNISFALAGEGCKSFVISSAVPSEGKSTTSVNIAVAFSQLGKKVLIVDADLRRPSIHKKLKLVNTRGLYSVLSGACSFDDGVQKINNNLDALTSGPLPSNPIELIQSDELDNLLEKLKEQYDCIIFDTPPINIVSDAVTLAPKTDGLVLVIKEGYTRKDDVHHAVSACKFANIRIIGSIINGINSKHSKKYSYNRYKSSYHKYSYK